MIVGSVQFKAPIYVSPPPDRITDESENLCCASHPLIISDMTTSNMHCPLLMCLLPKCTCEDSIEFHDFWNSIHSCVFAAKRWLDNVIVLCWLMQMQIEFQERGSAFNANLVCIKYTLILERRNSLLLCLWFLYTLSLTPLYKIWDLNFSGILEMSLCATVLLLLYIWVFELNWFYFMRMKQFK